MKQFFEHWTEQVIFLYRKMNETGRRTAIFVLAVIIAFSTMHILTFPASAMTRSAGMEDPGITVGTETEDEAPAETAGSDTDPLTDSETVNQVPEETEPEVLPANEPAGDSEGEPVPPALEGSEEPVITDLTDEGTDPAVTPDEETVTTPEPSVIPVTEPEEEPEEEDSEESDSTADVETAADWENMFREVELTGEWADELVTLAETQIGYTESEKNFIVDEEGNKHGYTRYGDWHKEPYAEWDSLFILFNLSYAGVTPMDFPFEADCETWIAALTEVELFRAADSYTPARGDLVFADTDEDGKADHTAIVTGVAHDEAENQDQLTVIEGDVDNAVKETTCELHNPLIIGYAVLPENPQLHSEPEMLTFTGTANRVEVTVLYEKGAFPDETEMHLETIWKKDVIDAISETVKEDNKEVVRVQAVDITFVDPEGNEVYPSRPIQVTMKSLAVPEKATEKPSVVHVDNDMNTSVVDAAVPADEPMGSKEAVTFEAETFSVYAIVYTVDFEYSVNGKMYQFSLPGGGFVSFTDLVEVLGINGNTSSDENGVNEGAEESGIYAGTNTVLTLDDVEVSEATRQFVADVVSVEFSSPDLVDVSKVNENTTVGQIKEIRGLECEYSAELTEDQIAEINGKEVESGDWALISMRAFDTEESLRVTMTDGEVFTIRVTDAQISKTVIDAKGDTWEITVIYGDDAQIPEDAELEAWEILPEDKAKDANDPGSGSPLSYDEYVSKAEDALGWDEGSSSYVRLFDISIVKKDDHTVKYQPAAGTTVDVHIELADSSSDVLNIVHFADENAGGDVVDAETSGQAVSFEADGFSVYAVVDGPGAIPIGWHKIESLDDLVSHTGGLYIGHINGYYFTNTLNTDSSGRTGIVKTTPAQSSPPTDRAALYYFESAGEGKYYIYCMNGSTKQYVKNENNNSLKFADDESDKTAFDVNLNSGVVTIHNGDWYWNMQSGNKGTRFCSWNAANDVNAKMNLWYYDGVTDDPYGLNGKSYGLMTWNGGKTAKAMMAAENGTEDDNDRSCLEAKFLTVMTKNEGTRDKLYVPNNTADTVTMWTFEWLEDDIYYVKGKDSSGSEKYLSITADGLSLADSPDSPDLPDGSCRIRVMPGSEGVHKGQICLKSAGDGTTLTYSNKYAQGFNVGGEAGLEWLYLVEEKPEDMLSDYEKVNTATKVSISDTVKVHDGQYVIIYTRQWKNDHYEYYALNGSGGLVPCEESGNSIEWIGSNLNDMLWEFTEYKDETTGDPNGYYELKNLYAESKGDPCYLAPKYSAAGTLQGIMSDKTVGLLMEGRRNQQYYSTIAAWDNPEYMYSSLLVDLNEADPAVKPCVRKDGLDFYFAIMDPLPVDDEIHTVPTIDNNQYGIKMRMIDLSNGPTNDANGQMNKFLGNTTANGMTFKHTPGLLSTNLVNGYPTAAGGSLDKLFEAGDSTDANHLFIESTYQATGYYEYNSAQN